MSDSVLIVGAGPAGLATAACLRRAGVPFRLVDRQGLPGGAYRHLYPRIELSSPARYTGLPGLAPPEDPYVTVEGYRAYLERYAAHHRLEVETLAVERLERAGGGFAVAGESYPAVVVCTGLYDTPWWPDIPGLQAEHARDWQGPGAEERLLILGGGASAVEIAEEAAAAGKRVVVSSRTGRVDLSPRTLLGRDVHDYAFALWWLPRRLLGSYCARPPTFTGVDQGFRRFQSQGVIRVRGPVTRCEGLTASFREGGPEVFDRVVAATGYRWEMPFLPPEVARWPGLGHPRADRCQSVNTPGLFFVGVHCCRGVSSQFLRGMALDAPVVAARLASGPLG